MNDTLRQIAEEQKKKLRLVKAAKKKLAAANAEIAHTIPIFESIAKHRKDGLMFAPPQLTRLLQSVRRAVKANHKRIKEAQAVLDTHEAEKQKRKAMRKEWLESLRPFREIAKRANAERARRGLKPFEFKTLK